MRQDMVDFTVYKESTENQTIFTANEQMLTVNSQHRQKAHKRLLLRNPLHPHQICTIPWRSPPANEGRYGETRKIAQNSGFCP